MPERRFIEWTDGETVETLVSQYVAYLDGRIQEAALDYYAQADDGSVWYFGEEVNDYRGGTVFSTVPPDVATQRISYRPPPQRSLRNGYRSKRWTPW